MIYQKILTEENPYQIFVGSLSCFAEHRHADIELHYCVKGELDLTINKVHYHATEGDLLLVGPMASHEVPKNAEGEQIVLTIIVGPAFLRHHFAHFSANSYSPISSLSSSNPTHQTLRSYLDLCLKLFSNPTDTSDLQLLGVLYQICAYLLDALAEPTKASDKEVYELRRVANIEKALEMIYRDYAKPLTIEEAALATGYGKSNFCKIFKQVVGDSFHHVLNVRRVKNACLLLRESDLSIASVGAEVGFAECKTFCRVFKAEMGVTPGVYRAQSLEK